MSAAPASPLRLAWVSPLPPASSGIADYSAELLAQLARDPELELEVFVDDPRLREVRRHGAPADLPVLALSELPERRRRGRLDAVLYHLGNEVGFHGAIYRALLEVPGISVLHEVVLHGLVAGLTLGRGDGAGFSAEMRYAYGRTGEQRAGRYLATGLPLEAAAYPLFERAVDHSQGVIVHNQTCRRRILASRPGARVEVIPHHLSLAGGERGGEVSDAAALRRRFGIPEAALLVASFGFVTPAKCLDRALAAFARLRRELPTARFLVVGEISPAVDVDHLLAGGKGEGVVVSGRVDLPTFLAAMEACDVAVNLRDPTGGETSGTLMRLLGLGKPVIVSARGAFAEIPAGCAAPVEPGEGEAELLFAVLRRLALDPGLRQAMGECARRHMAAHHSLEGSARAYAAVLRRAVEEGWEPAPIVPPLAPYPPEDLLAALAAEVGASLADLGLGGEAEALADLAAAVVDLDLDRAEGPRGRP